MSELIGPPHPELLQEEVDDEVLLLDPRSGAYYSLNRTAADVWRLADGELTGDEIVSTLAAAYGVEPTAIRQEVTATIDGFAAAGLFDPAVS